MPPQVLVVDDEAGVRESLRLLLRTQCEVATAPDVDSALDAIERSRPQLILLDLVMPRRSGLELLEELSERSLDIPVVVVTATTTISAAVEAMKRGAVDFVTKPFEVEGLRRKVRSLLREATRPGEDARHREEPAQSGGPASSESRGRPSEGAAISPGPSSPGMPPMVGRSRPMQELFETLRRVARASATVLIRGESGVGKELAARAIHRESPRSDGPFVALNCGAIPSALVESELFGHEAGAFTDAKARRIGRFEAAEGGTLFLDEIGELEAAIQVKLLRTLQERRFERVGGSESIEVDVRVLAATNRDLEAAVAEGRFREDLFYRVNVVPLWVPPLRDRRADIPVLAETFLLRHAPDRRVRLSTEARAALQGYDWPGNVRELENAIEHGIAMSDGDTIEIHDLPETVARAARAAALRADWRGGRIGFDDAVSRFEEELLREALDRQEWNQTRAAAELGITRRQLKLKMDRLGLKDTS